MSVKGPKSVSVKPGNYVSKQAVISKNLAGNGTLSVDFLGFLIYPVFESHFYGGAKIAFLATKSLHNLQSQSPLYLV